MQVFGCGRPPVAVVAAAPFCTVGPTCINLPFLLAPWLFHRIVRVPAITGPAATTLAAAAPHHTLEAVLVGCARALPGVRFRNPRILGDSGQGCCAPQPCPFAAAACNAGGCRCTRPCGHARPRHPKGGRSINASGGGPLATVGCGCSPEQRPRPPGADGPACGRSRTASCVAASPIPLWGTWPSAFKSPSVEHSWARNGTRGRSSHQPEADVPRPRRRYYRPTWRRRHRRLGGAQRAPVSGLWPRRRCRRPDFCRPPTPRGQPCRAARAAPAAAGSRRHCRRCRRRRRHAAAASHERRRRCRHRRDATPAACARRRAPQALWLTAAACARADARPARHATWLRRRGRRRAPRPRSRRRASGEGATQRRRAGAAARRQGGTPRQIAAASEAAHNGGGRKGRKANAGMESPAMWPKTRPRPRARASPAQRPPPLGPIRL